MRTIETIEALLANVTRDDIEALPPATRQRLAQRLRLLADIAEPRRQDPPKAGVLADLGRHRREG